MRPGEKLHEQLISRDESTYTYEFNEYFKILSPLNKWDSCSKRIKGGKKVKEGFVYTSDQNVSWLKDKDLKGWLDQIEHQ